MLGKHLLSSVLDAHLQTDASICQHKLVSAQAPTPGCTKWHGSTTGFLVVGGKDSHLFYFSRSETLSRHVHLAIACPRRRRLCFRRMSCAAATSAGLSSVVVLCALARERDQPFALYAP